MTLAVTADLYPLPCVSSSERDPHCIRECCELSHLFLVNAEVILLNSYVLHVQNRIHNCAPVRDRTHGL